MISLRFRVYTLHLLLGFIFTSSIYSMTEMIHEPFPLDLASRPRSSSPTAQCRVSTPHTGYDLPVVHTAANNSSCAVRTSKNQSPFELQIHRRRTRVLV